MEKVFIDTSALYALISTEDQNIALAVPMWKQMLEGRDVLFTNNYVLVECFALIQSRLGLEFVRTLQTNIVPFLQIDWIGEQQHISSVNDVFTANRRQLSLVDCSCFETMRRLGIEKVFTFDEHFHEQGFNIIP
ncbi:MAG TPA: PIN domain-containing protein [Anaerolineales bacterium]|nr:PIN domain-containing protein [Anaerolineales bacterium]